MNYIAHNAPWEKGKLWLGSAFVAIPGEQQYGLFTALNLSTGKVAWQNKVEQPMMGAALSTAGGLTFTGEGNGNFNAYNSKTGKLLWQFAAGCQPEAQLPAGWGRPFTESRWPHASLGPSSRRTRGGDADAVSSGKRSA